MLLTRSEMCAILGLEPAAFNTMAARNQLVLFTPDDAKGWRRYTPFEAMINTVVLHFSGAPDGHATTNDRAAAIISAAVEGIRERLADIAETSEAMLNGDGSVQPILVGRIVYPASHPDPFCGTAAELARDLAATGGDIVDLILTNMTRGAAGFRAKTAILRSKGVEIDAASAFEG